MFTKVTLRIEDPKEKDVDSEIIHLRVEGEPACNIISVYLKPGMDAEEAAETHAILHRKVDTCAAKGEDCIIMGDCNAPMNPDTRTKVAAQKIITDWEKSGKVRILNDKSKPTRVPTQENYQPNCVDLAFVPPGLTEKGIKQAVFFPADAQTLSAGNLNELTGILRGNPRVMSMREEFKRL